METFHIRFYFNNGKDITIELEQDSSFDLYSELKNLDEKWFRNRGTIVNLNNVNYIDIETESERKKRTDIALGLMDSY